MYSKAVWLEILAVIGRKQTMQCILEDFNLVVSKADHQTTKYNSRPNYFLMGESVHVCKGTCIAVAIITLK